MVRKDSYGNDTNGASSSRNYIRHALGILAFTFCFFFICDIFHAKEANASTGKKIVKQAERYLYEPYGFDRGEFSCSKLTSLAVGNVTGVWMPHWDDKQRFYGWRPKRTKPGDILFYKEHQGDGPVTHVGIYKGNGWIVHASQYWGYVTVTKTKYLDGYLYARRVR